MAMNIYVCMNVHHFEYNQSAMACPSPTFALHATLQHRWLQTSCHKAKTLFATVSNGMSV